MYGTRVKTSFVLLATILVAILAFALCGCGGSSSTAPGYGAFPDGAAAEYYQETGQMKTTKSTRKVSEADLGVPVYAGAKIEGGTAQVETDTCPAGTLETTQAVLVTPDPVDKVTQWYKGELSSRKGYEDHSYNQDGVEHGVFWFPTADGSDNVIVEKNAEGGGTKITVILQKEKNTQ